MSSQRYKILILLLLFTINSCKSENQYDQTVDGANVLEEGYTPHPEPERMPHPDIQAIELDLVDNDSALADMPENLQLLYHFLNDGNHNKHIQKLDLHVSSQASFHAASIDENTLIILDQRRNRLIQYSLGEDDFIELAPEGRGPGDILFTRDLQVFNNRIYIAMQGFRISIFNCETFPCEYERTISTDFNNYSVSPASNYVTVLGLYPFGREQDPDPENYNLPAVHIINREGDVKQSFSSVYRHMQPIIREQMNSRGTVISFPDRRSHFLLYSFFPYIYSYDNQGYLQNKYRLPNFQQGYYDYNEIERRGRFRHNDNSAITNATKLNNEWVILQIRNREDMYWNNGLRGKHWYSYYAFNADSHELHKIGEDSIYNTGEGRAIYTTEHGLVINEGGTSLYWIGN